MDFEAGVQNKIAAKNIYSFVGVNADSAFRANTKMAASQSFFDTLSSKMRW